MRRIAIACVVAPLIAVTQPATEQAKYVRLNQATHDVDIAFPERLGAKDFDQNPGPLRTLTVVLANHSEPTFQTTLKEASGTVGYRYLARNGDAARQAITRIYVVLPTLVSDAVCQAPLGWTCMETIPTPTDERALYYVTPKGLFVRLVTPLGPGNAAIGAGGAIEFEIRSKALPGLVRAYVQSGFVDEPSDLPGDVRTELEPYLRIDASTRRCVIVGPVFDAGTTISAMARQLKRSIEQLISERVLNRQSDFVKAADSVLSSAEETNSRQQVPQLGPRTDIEKSIDAVIQYDVGGAR